MAWKIEFDARAAKELAKLGRPATQRILKFLAERVAPARDPRTLGAALKGSDLGDFWKFRVGDYRVIAVIEDKVLHILVVRVGHRREVYRR